MSREAALHHIKHAQLVLAAGGGTTLAAGQVEATLAVAQAQLALTEEVAELRQAVAIFAVARTEPNDMDRDDRVVLLELRR